MKNIYVLSLAAGIALASCGPTRTVYHEPAPTPPPPVYNDPTPPQQAVEQDVTFQTFYDDLSPYGSWIEYPGYGYVWQPDAGPDFRPYATNGDWVYTDAGWTWNSNYQWGWAPFHYGRWFYQGGYGWMWVPGTEWAPAWVSWRGNNQYYGWAPLGPDVSEEIALNSYNPPVSYWNFMPVQYMGNPGWNQYYVNEGRNVTIINNTTIINNYSAPQRGRYSYAPGPDPNEVRRYTGTNVRPVAIREANRPVNNVSGNQYNIYRPRVAANAGQRAGNAVRPQPATVRPFRSSNDQRPAGTTQPNNPAYSNNGNNNGNNNNNNGNNNGNRPSVQNPNPGTGNSRPVVGYPANGSNDSYNNNRPAGTNPTNGGNGNNGRPSGQNQPVTNPNSNPLNNGSRPAMSPANRPATNNPVTTPAVTRPAPSNPNGDRPNNQVRPNNASDNRPGNLPSPNPVNRVPQNTPQSAAPAANNQRPVMNPVNRPATNNPVTTPAARPQPAVSRPQTNQTPPAADKPKTRDVNNR